MSWGVIFLSASMPAGDDLIVVPCADRAEAESLVRAGSTRLVEGGPEQTWHDPGDVEELGYNVMSYATVADYRAGGTIPIQSWPPTPRRW